LLIPKRIELCQTCTTRLTAANDIGCTQTIIALHFFKVTLLTAQEQQQVLLLSIAGVFPKHA
jgi:hypothetical protein